MFPLLKSFATALVVYSATFGLFLPWLCSNLGFSKYYNEPLLPYKRLDRRNDARIEHARKTLEWFALVNGSRTSQDRLEFCVVIVSVHRCANCHYLLQVAAQLLPQVVEDKGRSKLAILNADHNPTLNQDAGFLSRFITVLNRTSFSSGGGTIPSDLREKEKQDYIGALKIGLKCNADYILVVEDDALPTKNLLKKLRLVLYYKLPWSWLRAGTSDWAFLKLFYPEKWQGFGWPEVPELVLAGVSGALAAVTVQWRLQGIRRKSHVLIMFATWSVYFTLLVYTVGRAHLIELRKLVPLLHSVVKAPGCCTPAVLFQRQYAQKLAHFLRSVNCSKKYPIDLAMDDFAGHYQLRKYLVTPNLFTHIGVYSSLDASPKDFREFDLIFGP